MGGGGCGGTGLINILLVTRHLPSVASLTVLVEHVGCIVLGKGISSAVRCRRHASFCMVLSSILHNQWEKNICIIAHINHALVPFSLNGRGQNIKICTAHQIEFKLTNCKF